MGFVEYEQVVQALSAHTTKQALTEGVFLWGAVGGTHLLNACGRSQGDERRTEPAVVVANEVLGVQPERRGLAQLLGDPGIGWVTPTCTILRVARSSTKKAWIERNSRSVTGRKSQAQMP